MSGRQFSEKIKYETVKNNIAKNNGEVRCEICGTKVISIDECHFDHIVPYAKGGESNLANCQILCADCNLKKNDKELKDFVLEEKAKSFISGKQFSEPVIEETQKQKTSKMKMTKEEFDRLVKAFIEENGDIHVVDFSREYNNLPPVTLAWEYYGNLNNLKKQFGIEDLSLNWNRETIKSALEKYVEENGTILQKDCKKANNMPSVPCILRYYPEYNSFNEMKRELLGLRIQEEWTYDSAIQAGKEYLLKHNTITQKDLRAKNNLPTPKVIKRLFGPLGEYQRQLGLEPNYKSEFVTKDMIRKELDEYFGEGERVVQSCQVFFKDFPYSKSVVDSRYGGFNLFCDEENIRVIKGKKAKWTKREVDDAISNWVKEKKDIPNYRKLTEYGLPSTSSILKYYKDWREPFYYYQKLYEELDRN